MSFYVKKEVFGLDGERCAECVTCFATVEEAREYSDTLNEQYPRDRFMVEYE